MNNWPHVPLKTVCQINPRRTARVDVADEEPTSFVPMPAIDAGRGEIIEYLERPFGEIKKGYTYFENGDVIFAKITPCMQNGKQAICRNLRNGFGFGSTEFHVLRPGPSLLAPFLHHFLRQQSLLDDAERFLTGAVGQQRLPEDYLKNLEIPLPPLAEQERIAARLTEQLAVVASAHTAAQARLAASEALPAAYLREVFEGPEASEQETRRLGELIQRHNEIIHPGDREFGEAIFVGLEHIESTTGRRTGSLKIDLGNLTGRKPTFRRGQIVYGYLRPYLNKVWIAEFDGCSSVDQFAFDIFEEIADTAFVAAFMRSDTFLRRSEVVTTTGQLPRISIDEILAVEINAPPVAAQRRIAAALALRLAEVERLTAILRDELAAIDALPAALLRQAFNGYTDSQGG
jgi:restriction endonuclease S subunit